MLRRTKPFLTFFTFFVVLSSLLLTRPASADFEHRDIVYPIAGGASYVDTFGAPRSGGRRHEGQDLFAPKMRILVAAKAGKVSLRPNYGSLSGNMIIVTDDDGYKYYYMHVNNDNPGTDDGAGGTRWAFALGLVDGQRVQAGQDIGWLGDSGNAEGTPSHLHFEIRRPDGTPFNAWGSLRLAQGHRVDDRCAPNRLPKQTPSSASGTGYWAVGADGGVFPYGNAVGWGSTGNIRLRQPIVGMASTPGGAGYWLVAADGGVFPFGNAQGWGSTGNINLRSPIVGMAATPNGLGYWLVAADGGIFPFGNAQGWGSTGNINLRSPIVGMAATPNGLGYWLVAADGGIFPFGNATGWGSTGNIRLHAPIKGMATTPSGAGYWLVAADGGIFPFGNAAGRSSIPAYGLCATPTSTTILGSKSGNGYWIFNTDGGVWTFGDALGYGAPASLGRLAAPIVGGAAVPN